MTKQEKIQEAYGEHWEENVREEDGFLKYGGKQLDKENDFWECKEWLGYYFYRPKSLQGIENNNGWIKIESEADLPKEYGSDYWVVFNGKILQINRNLNNTEFWKHNITHYQPINKPLKPLY